jgi:predicted acyl esterase
MAAPPAVAAEVVVPDPVFERIKTVEPSTWPQVPFDGPPRTPEASQPTYAIREDLDVRIPMRDGVRLSADVFRPAAAGRRFPALVAISPYTRQVQRTTIVDGQNESGISAFWVPRGYVHVVVDVRGTNESEGDWDHMGPTERADLVDVIEWVAEQPWCDGNVGMSGESYFAWSQLMAATERPPHLRAIFPQCAAVDLYRERYFHGGIFQRGVGCWFYVVQELNGRKPDRSGIDRHQRAIMGQEEALDGPYFQERLSWPRLDRIEIPTYLNGSWRHVGSHLRGAFEAWRDIASPVKRMLIGPTPSPRKPMGAYHSEALRWYDRHLKGMDTGVLDGPPIQLWIPGLERWRGEREWPLARTEWRDYFLGAGGGGSSDRGLTTAVGPDGSTSYDYEPASTEAYRGGPVVAYRTEPFPAATEITGPLALDLWAASSATDTDWFVTVFDEAPGGRRRSLTNGWLRSSHRALDEARSTAWQPVHPHRDPEPLTPNEAYPFAIEVWPMSNVFAAGHRLRLEIASCDDQARLGDCHAALAVPATNTILEGRGHPSRLLVPVIPPA